MDCEFVIRRVGRLDRTRHREAFTAPMHISLPALPSYAAFVRAFKLRRFLRVCSKYRQRQWDFSEDRPTGDCLRTT